MIRIYFFTFFFLPLCLFSEKGYQLPWGKEASLSSYHKEKKQKQPNAKASLLAKVANQVILFRQNVLTKIDGPRSHFRPTSSRYMQLAIQRYGFLKGYLMGCDRLLRENNDKWIYPSITINNKRYNFDPAFDDKKLR